MFLRKVLVIPLLATPAEPNPHYSPPISDVIPANTIGVTTCLLARRIDVG